MQNNITSLQSLISALDKSNPKDYIGVIKRMQIDASEFLPYCSWKKESYTRNCIKRTDDYEMILLCWDKSAQTPIHGHNGQRCWVYQVQGDIIEYRYGKIDTDDLVEISNWKIRPSSLTFMDDKMGYHQLVNVSDGRSMTLHIYVNPIDECEVFDEETRQFKQKSMCYDSNGMKSPKKTHIN